jgi:cellulose synthase/poly-beta-1,6-N-acetylglucosamine synthase-like glycosyltransferase
LIVTLAADGIAYLGAQSAGSLLRLFWFVIVFEIPRYAVAFIAAAFFLRRPKPCSVEAKITAMIAGYNEENSVERCIKSLKEQSRPPDEIIVVSDGSSDRMREKLRLLVASGLVDQAHCTDLRAGKSAGVNLAWRHASGDILVNIDCDCTLHRDAIKNLVAPFADGRVGAVCGDIIPRNREATLVTRFQAIEYLICISLGKQAASLTDHVTCVSGAFGAFRREAFEASGGLDAGGGEDLDVTLRLRGFGWKVRFAADATCYTEVPPTVAALLRQRLRWERDAIRLRFRKHRELINPLSRRFQPLELAHELEYLLFNVVGAAAMPLYMVWLFVVYGSFAPAILLAAQAGLFFLDALTLSLAAFACPRAHAARLFPYLLGYSVYYGVFMRFVRLFAYAQEWSVKASYADAYVPRKVQLIRG